MKSVKIQGINIVYEGEGTIPALITGPAEIYISTFTDELKKECVFFGANYPWRRKPQDIIDENYRPAGWQDINDVVKYYYHIAKLFCSHLGYKKCLAVGPSILAALADKLLVDHPDTIHGACLLSPISLIEMSVPRLANTIMEEFVDTNDLKQGSGDLSFLSFDDAAVVTNKVTSDFYYYLDTLRVDSDKDFSNETILRSKWIELWEKGSDNVETISFLLQALSNYRLGKSASNVLMVSGEKDGRYPINLAKSLNISKAYKHIVMPGGHATHFEYQNEFTDVFIAWLIDTGFKKTEPKISQRTKDLRKAHEKLAHEMKIRKRIEKDLKQSELHFRTLSAMSPVGIFRMDAYGRSLYFNEEFKRITGITQSIISNEDWLRKVHPEDRQEIQEKLQKCIQEHVKFVADYRFVTYSSIIWVQGQVVAERTPDGKLSGLIGTFTDITWRREAEEKLHEHQVTLAHFSRLNIAGEMVSGLAHEINQPLSSIVQFIGGTRVLLSEFEIPSQAVEGLKFAESEAERAGAIIERIRNFVKKGRVQKAWLELDEVIESVLNLMKYDIGQAQVEVSVEKYLTPLRVFADKVQLEQVFMNFIRNSLDALGGKLIENKKIRIKYSPFNYKVRVEISDTGCGMDQKILDNIFNPFYTTKTGGMGIGLSISQTIIEAHKGSLFVESEVGKGTSMIVELMGEGNHMAMENLKNEEHFSYQ